MILLIIIIILLVIKLKKLENFNVFKNLEDYTYYSINPKNLKISFIENQVLLNCLFNINTKIHKNINKDLTLLQYLKNINIIKKYNKHVIIKKLNIFLIKKYNNNNYINNEILFSKYKDIYNELIKNYAG